jgi:hypothetical protein
MRFARFGLAVLLGGVALGVCAFLAPAPAQAVFCSTDLMRCRPTPRTGGYTYNQTWDCGVITDPDICYFNGSTDFYSASLHTWGFGSASYPGTGDVEVCIANIVASGATTWYDCGFNLARACAQLDCRDVDGGTPTRLGVYPRGTTHTVNGHGEA